MLDIKRIRQNPQELFDALKARNADAPVDEILLQDEKRRKLLAQAEEKKSLRNSVSKKLGAGKKNGSSPEEMNIIMEEVRALGKEIDLLDAEISSLDNSLEAALLSIPNFPHESVPIGAGAENHAETKRWGTPRPFPWEPKTAWDIGIDLKILDRESACHLSGDRFTVYRGLGARLERAIINFLMDIHCDDGYEEIFFPYQHPRFVRSAEEDPVINLYRDSILDSNKIPVQHCASSTTSLSAAVTAGHDACGSIKLQHFNNMELVKITKPEQSYEALDHMTVSLEHVLQLLGLPYRVALLSTGDMSFSAAKTYAIEVWMPSANRYIKISSISNCEEFLARRAGIRYRETPKEKPQYAHTLHGDIAVEQTVAAILENYQNEDGTVTVPEVLIPYMRTRMIK